MGARKSNNWISNAMKIGLVQLFCLYAISNLMLPSVPVTREPPVNYGDASGTSGFYVGDVLVQGFSGKCGVSSTAIGPCTPSISGSGGRNPPIPHTLQQQGQPALGTSDRNTHTSGGSSGSGSEGSSSSGGVGFSSHGGDGSSGSGGVDSGGNNPLIHHTLQQGQSSLGISSGGDPNNDDRDKFRVYLLAQTIPKVFYLFCKKPPKRRAEIGSVVHGLWVQRELAAVTKKSERLTPDEVRRLLHKDYIRKLHEVWRCLDKCDSKKDSIHFWISEYVKHGGKYVSFLEYVEAIRRLEVQYRASVLIQKAVAQIPMLEVTNHIHKSHKYTEIKLGVLQQFLIDELKVSPTIVTREHAKFKVHFVEEIYIIFDKDLNTKLNNTAAGKDCVEGSLHMEDVDVVVLV